MAKVIILRVLVGWWRILLVCFLWILERMEGQDDSLNAYAIGSIKAAWDDPLSPGP